jgi:pimeloyl-ACP methyl ester carboxylesterase
VSLGSLVAIATERIVEPVEGMHRTISSRWFSALGPVAHPVRLVHDTISGVVYGSIRLAARGLGAGVDSRSGEAGPSGVAAQAFANGLWGDALGRHHTKLAIEMAIRDAAGAPVAIDHGLADAFPTASGRLVLLLHGLVETEIIWHGDDATPGLMPALGDHPELTPVQIRYNSGLHISQNGANLAGMLDELSANWPVPIESIAIVGHSMGGLVARSALAAGMKAGHGWIHNVHDVVAVGTPHHGAPLEKMVNVIAWGLGAARSSRPLGTFLNGRSAGIKDLRYGAITEDDWKYADPDALLQDTVGDHSLPEHVRHHFVAGAITADPLHPVGAMVGDLMVRPSSGAGSARLEPANVVVLGGHHHFSLVHDPEVVDHIMTWLTPVPIGAGG